MAYLNNDNQNWNGQINQTIFDETYTLYTANKYLDKNISLTINVPNANFTNISTTTNTTNVPFTTNGFVSTTYLSALNIPTEKTLTTLTNNGTITNLTNSSADVGVSSGTLTIEKNQGSITVTPYSSTTGSVSLNAYVSTAQSGLKTIITNGKWNTTSLDADSASGEYYGEIVFTKPTEYTGSYSV